MNISILFLFFPLHHFLVPVSNGGYQENKDFIYFLIHYKGVAFCVIFTCWDLDVFILISHLTESNH